MEMWHLTHEEAFLVLFLLEEKSRIIFTILPLEKLILLPNSSVNRDGTPNIALKKVFNKFFPLVASYVVNFHVENVIASIDFNPNGETVATMDYYGTCLLSDVNTDNYSFHLNMEMTNMKGKQYFSIFKIFSVPSFFPIVTRRIWSPSNINSLWRH